MCLCFTRSQIVSVKADRLCTQPTNIVVVACIEVRLTRQDYIDHIKTIDLRNLIFNLRYLQNLTYAYV